MAGNTNGLLDVYGVVMVMVPGFTVTVMFCVSELNIAGGVTVTVTADDVEGP
jgi:hypothetical protein